MKFLQTRTTKKATLFLVCLMTASTVGSALNKNSIQCDSAISPTEKEPITNVEITGEDLLRHIKFLSSDSLKGRQVGSNEDKLAREYIRDLFKKSHLDLLYDNGFQKFSFASNMIHFDCSFQTAGFTGMRNRDYWPIVATDSSHVVSQIDFVGYGYDYIKGSTRINNYAGINVKGNWVLFFEGKPKALNIPGQGISERYDIAKKQGAAGVLLIEINETSYGFFKFPDNLNTKRDFTRPFFQISKAVADTLFKKVGLTTMGVLDSMTKSKNLNFHIPHSLEASIQTKRDSLYSANVVACLPGKDPVLKKEYIIVGAHYDHLGSSKILTSKGDSSFFYPGADDNASGVAAMVEIAEKLSADTLRKRSILFVAFGSEEERKHGSIFMAEHLPVQKSNIRLMINMDMIGRMDSLNTLIVNTIDPNISLRKTLDSLSQVFPTLKLKFESRTKFNSDFAPFYLKKIRVVTFTTGVHPQYHTPNDSAGLINLEGEKMIASYIYDLVKHETNAGK